MAGNGKVVAFEVVDPPADEGERLRELATQITSRAQLEAIIADADPLLRADVRLMLEALVVLPPEG